MDYKKAYALLRPGKRLNKSRYCRIDEEDAKSGNRKGIYDGITE